MDYQCFFKDEQNNYANADVWRGFGQKFTPQPCPYISFEHTLDSPDKVEVGNGELTDCEALPWLRSVPKAPVQCQLRMLLTPARQRLQDENGKEAPHNPEAPIPFTQKTFNEIVDVSHFHKGFFKKQKHSQVARILDKNIIALYIETGSHRDNWFKVFVSFDCSNQNTTVMLHNLLAEELEFINQRLNDIALHPLTIHPLFILVLILELLFKETSEGVRVVFSNSIRQQHKGDLHTNERFRHLKQINLDLEKEAAWALGNEQFILGLLEKVEFTIKMGTKVMSWFKEFDASVEDTLQRDKFKIAGDIIHNRFEYLVDGLEFQMIRLKRARSHSQLNRLGLEGRNTTLGNSLNYQISEQSRNIAQESKRDSSAMKAIAVLTMVFLPGTFVAAFFAMPLFDWNATSGSVMNSRFWIYWATTIPATITVLIMWRLWFVFEDWRRQVGAQNSVYTDLGLWLRPEVGMKRREVDVESRK